MTAPEFSLFPQWLPVAAARPAMSAPWWQWVASTDSLTARLMAAGKPGAFRVRVLRQTIGLPQRDEALARRHVLDEAGGLGDGKICSGNTAQGTAGDDHHRLPRRISRRTHIRN